MQHQYETTNQQVHGKQYFVIYSFIETIGKPGHILFSNPVRSSLVYASAMQC